MSLALSFVISGADAEAGWLSVRPSRGSTDCMTYSPDKIAAELAIRARRASFNRAIAAGDAQAIAPLLARDCVMLTGTDSAVIAGRLAQVKVWRREFADPARSIYLRTPTAFDISAVEPIALEHGAWVANTPSACTASGSYAAKWRLVADEWVIEAEVFVTLA